MHHHGVWRWALAVTTLLVGLSAIQSVAATTVPGQDPNAIVPAAFSGAMSWSQEGSWHWVEISYDGTRRVGEVRRMVPLPSCEALEVDDLLIPMVRDAIRSIDVDARRIDVDTEFLG